MNRRVKPWTIVPGYRVTAPLVVAVLGANLLFLLQDHIVTFVNSYHLCSASAVISVIGSVIPKISSHCYQIMDSDPLIYPSMRIVIILDLWYLVCFFTFSTYTILKLTHVTKEDINLAIVKHWGEIQPSVWQTILYLFFAPLGIILGTFNVFIESPILQEPDTVFFNDKSISTISGVTYQAGFSMIASLLFVHVVFIRIEIILRGNRGDERVQNPGAFDGDSGNT